MRLSLEALEVLDAIGRHGSFAAAAEVLNRVPSAVTYAVQKLEQDLGAPLFDRSGHRAVLTEAGAELLREGRHLLHAADELEARVKRVATGYEAELRLAVDDIIPFPRLFPLLQAFYGEACGTRLRILFEVYGGTWDALVDGRADLVIGAAGDGPPGGGYGTRPLGMIEFVFMVAPSHPLAEAPEPLAPETILKHRAISAADSSRRLPPRTSGLLTGQDVLTVPDMRTKIEAQRAGLGVGFIPKHLGLIEAQAGRLRIKEVLEPRPSTPIFVAWPSAQKGKALAWLLKRLVDEEMRRALLS